MEFTLPVLIVQHIRRMRGGAQSHLMLGADGHLYVVKFRNNPQHERVLVNEMLATRLAAAAGLTVPETEVVEVPEWLVEHSPEMTVDLGRRCEPCRAGLNFGARYVGGLMPGQVMDYLPEQQLGEVRNLAEFAGILALDKWVGNADKRQAVFKREARERRYTAVFIDQGFCFNAGEWQFEDAPLRGVYPRNAVYARVTGWESFEPWLSRMEAMAVETIWATAEAIPPEWYGGDVVDIELLVEMLYRRRGRIRELVESFANSGTMPFPEFEKRCPTSVVGKSELNKKEKLVLQ